jgi:hypothetical protein
MKTNTVIARGLYIINDASVTFKNVKGKLEVTTDNVPMSRYTQDELKLRDGETVTFMFPSLLVQDIEKTGN